MSTDKITQHITTKMSSTNLNSNESEKKMDNNDIWGGLRKNLAKSYEESTSKTSILEKNNTEEKINDTEMIKNMATDLQPKKLSKGQKKKAYEKRKKEKLKNMGDSGMNDRDSSKGKLKLNTGKDGIEKYPKYRHGWMIQGI